MVFDHRDVFAIETIETIEDITRRAVYGFFYHHRRVGFADVRRRRHCFQFGGQFIIDEVAFQQIQRRRLIYDGFWWFAAIYQLLYGIISFDWSFRDAQTTK